MIINVYYCICAFHCYINDLITIRNMHRMESCKIDEHFPNSFY